MNNREFLEKEYEGLKEAKQKTNAFYNGIEELIIYRTIVIGTSAVVLGGTIDVMNKLAEYISTNNITNETALKLVCAGLGIVVGCVISVSTVVIGKHQVVNTTQELKEYGKLKKFGKDYDTEILRNRIKSMKLQDSEEIEKNIYNR